MLTLFEQKVLRAVKKVPQGKLATYQSIAQAIGKPKAIRAVGNAVKKNPHPFYQKGPKIPCHRVIKSNGQIGGFSGPVKRKIGLLTKEGVRVNNNKVVDFKKHLYKNGKKM